MSQPPKRPGPPSSPPASKEPPSTTSSFAVEEPSSVSEMPSVTRLLNRSRFGLERTQTRTQNEGLPPLLKTEELMPMAPPSPPPVSRAPSFSPEPVASPPPLSLKKSPPPPSPQPFAPPADAPSLEVLHSPESDVSATPSQIQINDISLATDTRFLATGEVSAASPTANEGPVEIAIALPTEPAAEPETSPSQPAALSLEPAAPIEVSPEPSLSEPSGPVAQEKSTPAASGSPTEAGTSEIRTSARSLQRHNGFEPSKLWLFDELKFGADPLGKGMAGVLESGKARGMSFLQSRPGSPRPIFESFGVSGVEASRYAWLSGMVWDSLSIPDLWTTFLKAGVLEISPPPASPQKVTAQSQARSLARKLFGASSEETLTLARVGTQSATRGVLVILSKQSVLEEVNAAMIEFQSAGPEHSPLFSTDASAATQRSPTMPMETSSSDSSDGEIRIELAA